MNINEKLKLLRKTQNKTREQVASDLGIKVRALQTYETGERIPPTEMLAELAKYYNVSADYILGLSDIATTEANIEEIKFSNDVMNKLATSFDLLPDSTKINIINWLKDAVETINKDENKPAEEEPVLFIAASDGNPITEIDKGVIERLRNAPEIDPSEFDNL